MSKAQDLLERMDKGEAIIASNETLNALEVLGRDDIKSALNKDRVGTKDTYVVWLLLRKGKSGGAYIQVTVDAKGGGSWTAGLDNLSDQAWLTYDQWGRFDLDAGRHTLTIQNKSGKAIEKILITNDQSLCPPGHVNILSGW